MKLAAPLIIAAHVARLPTLPGWDGVTVYDGAKTSRDDVRRYVTVGYVSGDDGPVVHTEPITAGQGQSREAGSIASNLIVTAPDVAAARTAVFDLITAWAQWLADEPTLPVDGNAQLLPTSQASLVFDVVLTTTRAGATASAVVTITYSAHTYG